MQCDICGLSASGHAPADQHKVLNYQHEQNKQILGSLLDIQEVLEDILEELKLEKPQAVKKSFASRRLGIY